MKTDDPTFLKAKVITFGVNYILIYCLIAFY